LTQHQLSLSKAWMEMSMPRIWAAWKSGARILPYQSPKPSSQDVQQSCPGSVTISRGTAAVWDSGGARALEGEGDQRGRRQDSIIDLFAAPWLLMVS
jgi:hypothetical protein